LRLREKVENNPAVFFLGTLLVGFLAGLGCYQGILEVAHLEVVPAGSLESGRSASARPAREDPGDSDSALPGSTASSPGSPDPAITSGGAGESTANAAGALSQVVRAHGLEVLFQRPFCEWGSSSCLQCEVLATSQAGDREMSVPAHETSRLIDSRGSQYRPSAAGFGPRLSLYAKSLLVEGVPTRIVYRFCKADGAVGPIALLELGLSDPEGGLRARFRGVPLRGEH
jgi:hypothetical protein